MFLFYDAEDLEYHGSRGGKDHATRDGQRQATDQPLRAIRYHLQDKRHEQRSRENRNHAKNPLINGNKNSDQNYTKRGHQPDRHNINQKLCHTPMLERP